MTKMVFRKVLGHLVPVDEEAQKFLAQTKFGQDVMVEARRARNPRHHRKLFALLKLVVENQEHYKTVEHLLDALKVATGNCKEYPTYDGTLRIIVPLSISFESMDQVAFSEWYDRAVNIICAKIIHGTDSETLKAEVDALLDGPYAL
jgi:hypothetical protein